MATVTVAGKINDGRFMRAKTCAESLMETDPGIEDLTVLPMFASEFEAYLAQKCKELAGKGWQHKGSPIVFDSDGNYMGSDEELLKWAETRFRYVDNTSQVMYQKAASNAYKDKLRSSNRRYLHMDIQVDGEAVGRMMLELYSDLLPATVDKFVNLCKSSPGYLNGEIDRIVPDGWIQAGGGDLQDELTPDESFAIKHDKPGVLGFCNSGPHTNSTNFYMTLRPLPHMDCQTVAFGQVIEGLRVLRSVEKVPTNLQKPVPRVTISRCEEYLDHQK